MNLSDISKSWQVISLLSTWDTVYLSFLCLTATVSLQKAVGSNMAHQHRRVSFLLKVYYSLTIIWIHILGHYISQCIPNQRCFHAYTLCASTFWIEGIRPAAIPIKNKIKIIEIVLQLKQKPAHAYFLRTHIKTLAPTISAGLNLQTCAWPLVWSINEAKQAESKLDKSNCGENTRSNISEI